MLKIRLTRVGKKNSPSYRVVVADKRRAVKRKFIEIIGNYNPTLTPKQLVIDKERALFWMGNGAQPSDTVNNLMVRLGILAEDKKIMKIYSKALSKKAIKEGPKAPEAPKMDHEQNEPLKEEETATAEEAPVKEVAETVEAEVEAPAEETVEVESEVAEEAPTEQVAEEAKPEEKSK